MADLVVEIKLHFQICPTLCTLNPDYRSNITKINDWIIRGSAYLTFADGIETLCGTLSPFTASSMKRNTKKLPSSPAVNTYLSSKLVLMCWMPPWSLSCTFSAQNELKCSKSFDPSRGWIRRTPSSIPRRRNLPEWLKQPRGKGMLMTTVQFKNYTEFLLSRYKCITSVPFGVKKIGILHINFYPKVLV